MAPSVLVGSFAVLALTAVFLACVLRFGLFARRKHSPLPPGPRGWPLIGNLLDMPHSGSEWVQYSDLCKKYESDVVYLNVMGIRILVLNSLEVITDLLDKRSAIYSSRPRMPMGELTELSRGVAAHPYGAFWRAHRRLFRAKFGIPSKHYPHQIRSVNDFLGRLLESPEHWAGHLRHQTGAMILDIAYGIRALPNDDPYIDAAERVVAIGSYVNQPGRFLVNFLPWLKYIPTWVPGATFHRVAREGREEFRRMSSVPFQNLKEAFLEGTATPSFGADCMEAIDHNGDVPFQELVIENTTATLFAAGGDTTISVISTLFLAMVKYPAIQAKAQQELDTVLGLHHLPSFGDEESLPYLTAIVKECLRWQVVLPISIPHQSTADDEYMGYHIPAGTLVIPNTWAVLNDETMYSNPYDFNPDRFMKDGKLDPSVRDPEAAFGYGRRICPGRDMARGTVWLTAGRLLAAFNVSKAVDPNGGVIEPSVEYAPGLLRQPAPFACVIRPRSEKMEQLIRHLQSKMD